MIDIIRDAERRSLNVVPLHDLLKEGGCPVPSSGRGGAAGRKASNWTNRSLACSIPWRSPRAIRWMETLDFGSAWKRFDQALPGGQQDRNPGRPQPERRAIHDPIPGATGQATPPAPG